MTDREKFEQWVMSKGAAWWANIYPEQAADFAWQASRRAALEETIQIIETHRVPIGNSAAGEMAAGWTMDALHEIRDAIRQLAEGGKHE